MLSTAVLHIYKLFSMLVESCVCGVAVFYGD